MKKSNLNYEELISLCDKFSDHYESKSEQAYVDALEKVFPLKNRNDKPFLIDDIIFQPTLDEFEFEGVKDFKFICKLHCNPMILDANGNRIKNEKIVPTDFSSKEAEDVFKNSLGVVYMLTCPVNGKEHIVKFGQTRTPFKSRLGSYNCGVVNNWRTASTTNFKMVQSLLATRKTYNLYLIDCSAKKETFTWHGVESVPFSSAITLAYEDILVKEFQKQFGRPPLDNVQANATVVED